MTRPSLAGIEKRAAEATEGPWETYSVPAFRGEAGYVGVEVGETEVRVARFEGGHFDGAFIADARTAVPALTAAVRDVLALHQEDIFRGHLSNGCATCGGDYPCETVRALAAHLDLTDPEGDPT